MDRPPVELVRVSVESDDDEKAQDRDVTSVFPTESQKFKSDAVQELKTSVQDRFISESKLHEAQASELGARDASGNQGMNLAGILAENKRKKEEEFQDQWRTMKQGKNRPLDPDDYAFVDAVYKEQAEKAKAQFDDAQRDVEDFKKARKEATLSTEKRPKTVSVRPKKRSSLRPLVKVVPKKRTLTAKREERDLKKE